MAKKKPAVDIQVTGRTVAYIQTLDPSGKLGKAKPFVVTTVNATPPKGSPVTKKTRRKK